MDDIVLGGIPVNRQTVSASNISLFVKHPHGKLTIIGALAPPDDPHPLPSGGRRPVVALLDSEVQSHPWLQTRNGPWWTTVRRLDSTAEMIDEPETRVDVLPKDQQFSDDDTVVAEPFVQHGTFNAGIIRQLAPDATVFSLPVMDTSEDIAHADVQHALAWVRDQTVEKRQDSFVDVVCLPFGYLATRAPSEHQLAERALFHELAALGVRVVAAAGNFGTDIEVFPAAFALEHPATGPALVSVGALDPNGERAPYSNFGDWVTHWELGTDIDSIVSEPPEAFARGRGTSFAASRLSGKLVAELSRDLVALADLRPPAAIARAEWALQQVTG